MKNENHIAKIIPVMLVFFTMGFVDLVGIATNYVKNDFNLTDTAANSFSVMLFLWFLIFSVPTGILMNKIGRKKTVLISLVVTFSGLCIPAVLYTNYSMVLCFCLLGMGNTFMQVSLNPLVTNIVSHQKLPGYLTLGQFVKAIASFMAPVIAGRALLVYGDWKLLFPVFAAITLLAMLGLFFTPIQEKPVEGTPSTFTECFGLLGDKMILLLFLGILVHVGIDVGINITAPKLLMERSGMVLGEAGYATSLYFLFRTFGCLAGTFILSKYPPRNFFMISTGIILAGVAGLYFSYTSWSLYVCVALIGVGNSNVFPVIFSRALSYMPSRNNEVSGLMIMGISGGAVFPVLMGFASDALGGQTGAVIVLTFCAAYLAFLIRIFKR
ncbi:MAG: MFS transporter [Tannerellaceae bacterium]|nr:MFS transporter [Tannerellaceae bacterium]